MQRGNPVRFQIFAQQIRDGPCWWRRSAAASVVRLTVTAEFNLAWFRSRENGFCSISPAKPSNLEPVPPVVGASHGQSVRGGREGAHIALSRRDPMPSPAKSCQKTLCLRPTCESATEAKPGADGQARDETPSLPAPETTAQMPNDRFSIRVVTTRARHPEPGQGLIPVMRSARTQFGATRGRDRFGR